MNILIFQTGEPLHIDEGNPRPMRAMNLANKFIDNGHNVVILSSRFYHQEKKQRIKPDFTKISKRLSTYLISSPGYKKNISLSRFYDHIVLALNLRKFLKSNIIDTPDLIITGYPPIETAYVLSRWAKKNNILYVLDIKDQWPTVIVDSIPWPINFFASIVLSPMFLMAKYAMRNASINVSISSGFLNWVKKFSGLSKSNQTKVLPLAAPNIVIHENTFNQSMKWWSDYGIQKNENLKIAFVGSFSRAFNFDFIFQAAKYFEEKNLLVEFIICGQGEQGNQMQLQAQDTKNVKIIEWIDIPKIKTLEHIVDLYIAPYISTDDFKMSIPNKVIDAFMAGLPVITSLDGDLKNLVEQKKAGFYYNSASTLISVLGYLDQNREEIQEISANASELYSEKFHFDSVYDNFINEIEELF